MTSDIIAWEFYRVNKCLRPNPGDAHDHNDAVIT